MDENSSTKRGYVIILRQLTIFIVFGLLASCVPQQESDFTTFATPELQDLDGLSTDEEVSISFEVKELVIDNEDEAQMKMSERYVYSIMKYPSNGRLENCLVGQSVKCTYIPNKDFFGVDEFKYVAVDGPIQSNAISVKINVANINDPPTFDGGDNFFVLNEDEKISMTLDAAQDVDRDKLVYRVIDKPANGSLSGCFKKGMTCYYKPNKNFYGNDYFTYMATDGEFDTSIRVVKLKVRSINDQPYFDSYISDFMLNEDTSISIISDLAFDVETPSQKLGYVISRFPKNGKLTNCKKTASKWSCTYTPYDNVYGSDSFELFAVDEDGAQSRSKRFNINIISVPDAPKFSTKKIEYQGVEDQALSFWLEKATDADGDIKHYEIVNKPGKGKVIDCLDKTLDLYCTYTPERDWNGSFTFDYKVVDSVGNFAVKRVYIKYLPVNDPPKLVYKNMTEDGVKEDMAHNFKLSPVRDPDIGDVHTYYNISKPKYGTISCVKDDCMYMPGKDFSGTDFFTYKVKDMYGLSDSGRVNITVLEVDDPPNARDYTLSNVLEDTPKVFDIPLADDRDSKPEDITYGLEVAPKHGTIKNCFTGNKRTGCIYVPNPNYYGSDEFQYYVKDKASTKVIAKVTIDVIPVNDAPYWVFSNGDEDKANTKVVEITDEDVALVFSKLYKAKDLEDGDNLNYVVTGAPKNGTLSPGCLGLKSLNCTYTPNPNFYGVDFIKYIAKDTKDSSTPVKTVEIRVKAVNDLPVFQKLTELNTKRNTPISFTLPKVTDQDYDPIVIKMTSSLYNGNLKGCLEAGQILNQLKQCTYTPKTDFEGDEYINFTVTDGKSAPIPGKIYIKVEDPYIREFKRDIDVEELEKSLIKIAILVDTTQSMKQYQSKLVNSLTPMFEKLYGYNVELHLFVLNPLITGKNFVNNHSAGGGFINGRVVLNDDKHNVGGGQPLRKAIFKVDPKATQAQVNTIASEISKKIEEMGATQAYAENGLHNMGLLLSHPETPFSGKMKFGGFIVLTNEESYANDSVARNPGGAFDNYRTPNYTFTEFRRRKGESTITKSTKRRPGDWFGHHAMTFYYKVKTQDYIPTYSHPDGRNSGETCGDRANLSYDRDGSGIYGQRCGTNTTCARCVDENCSNITPFKDSYTSSYSAQVNRETGEIVRNAFVMTCTKTGSVKDDEKLYGIHQVRKPEDGFTEDKCEAARQDVLNYWADKDYTITRLNPETGCWKNYYLNESFSSPPSYLERQVNGNGPYGTYELVQNFLTARSLTLGHLARNEYLKELIVDLIEERIGLENAYTNFIIHEPGIDKAANCENVVGTLGSTNGLAYKDLHDLLVSKGIANSSITSICSGNYSNALDGLKEFIEAKTNTSFVIKDMADNMRAFSVKLIREGQEVTIVKNKDYSITKNKDGDYEIIFFKDGEGNPVFKLLPEDKISIIIREYAY